MKSPHNTPCNHDSEAHKEEARKENCYPIDSLDWHDIDTSFYRPESGLHPIIQLRPGSWLVDSEYRIVCSLHMPTAVSPELKWALHSVKRQTTSDNDKPIVLDVFECKALLEIAEIIPWTSKTYDSDMDGGYPSLTCERPVGIERLGRASRLDFVGGARVVHEFQESVTFSLTGGEHHPRD